MSLDISPTACFFLLFFFVRRKNSSDNLPFSRATFAKKDRIVSSPWRYLAFVKVSPGSRTSVWNRDRSHHIWLCSWNSSNRPTFTARVPSIAAFLASSSAFPSAISLSLSLFSINSQIGGMEIIDRTRYRRLQGFFLLEETGRPVNSSRDYATWMQRGEICTKKSIDFRLELRLHPANSSRYDSGKIRQLEFGGERSWECLGIG